MSLFFGPPNLLGARDFCLFSRTWLKLGPFEWWLKVGPCCIPFARQYWFPFSLEAVERRGVEGGVESPLKF